MIDLGRNAEIMAENQFLVHCVGGATGAVDSGAGAGSVTGGATGAVDSGTGAASVPTPSGAGAGSVTGGATGAVDSAGLVPVLSLGAPLVR